MYQKTIKNTMKVNTLLMAGRKCASTYLMNVFLEHPEIFLIRSEQFIPNYKTAEMRFIDISSDAIGRPYMNQKVVAARRNMKVLNKEAANNYYKYNPNIKIVGFIRNPVYRTYSNYFQQKIEELNGQKKIGQKDMSDFSRTFFGTKVFDINKDLQKRNLNNYYKEIDMKNLHTVEEYFINSFYYYLYKEFYKLFSDNNLFIVPLEIFQENPKKFLAEIFRFLEVNTNINFNNSLKKSELKKKKLKMLKDSFLYLRSG